MKVNFPRLKPNSCTISKFKSNNFRVRYNALRNSSDAFIKKADVRKYIFEKSNHKCYICGATENLQIDHVVSVYCFALKRFDYRPLNEESNLKAICRKCNSSKEV